MAQSNSSIDGNHFCHLDWRYTHCQAIQITKTDMSIDSCTDFHIETFAIVGNLENLIEFDLRSSRCESELCRAQRAWLL